MGIWSGLEVIWEDGMTFTCSLALLFTFSALFYGIVLTECGLDMIIISVPDGKREFGLDSLFCVLDIFGLLKYQTITHSKICLCVEPRA